MYEERGNLKMRKKIIATLLAVSLLVSLAMPAFASTNSNQSGDPEEVTMVAFDETSYAIQKDESVNFEEEVKAFASKDQLVLDPNLTFEIIDDNNGVFSMDGANISAVEKTGSATLIVKNIDDKKVGSIKITATNAKPEARAATGFRFEERTYNVPVASLDTTSADPTDADKYTIKVIPTPTGAVFTQNNVDDIAAKVNPALTKALDLKDLGGVVTKTKATVTVDFTSLLNTELAADATVMIGGVKVFTATGIDGAATRKPDMVSITKALEATSYTFGTSGATTAFGKPTIKDNVATFTVSTGEGPVTNGLNKTEVDKAVLVADTSNTTIAAFVDGTTVTGSATSPITHTLNTDGEIEFTVASLALTDDLVNDAYAAANKDVSVEVVIEEGDDASKAKTVSSKAVIKAVKGKVAIGVSAPSSITIEVGETYDIEAKAKHVASDSNIKSTISFDEDYINADAIDYDYAIVDDGIITGIAVGKNKIVSTMKYTNSANVEVTKSATTIVNVVAKGTLPTDPEESTDPAINPTVNMMAGGTYKINVKNADASKVTFSSYNAKVATVAADGTVKAIANGTTKIAVMIDGSETLYVTLTVKDMPKPVDPTKPTTPPATGVGA